MALKHCLDPHERVEADLGYIGENPGKVKTLGLLYTNERYISMKKAVASHHKTINKHLKQYACLTQHFWHSVAKHAACFRAVSVLTQLAIEAGEPLFDVDYENNL